MAEIVFTSDTFFKYDSLFLSYARINSLLKLRFPILAILYMPFSFLAPNGLPVFRLCVYLMNGYSRNAAGKMSTGFIYL